MADFDLPPDLFPDPTRASDSLLTLHEAFIRSGSTFPVDQFSPLVNKQLLSSPDPGMALVNLLRFCEVAVSKAALFNDFIQYPVTFDLLMKIFGHSQYFADILVREPGLFRWLTTTDVLSQPLSRTDLREEIGRLRDAFPRPERRLESLKRIHRREMLRIGTQDLLGVAGLAVVTLQLSDLADMLVDEVCRISAEQLGEKFGQGPGIPFAVIGLGKLGGQELNYSSDIDVVFVYESDGELVQDDGNTISRHEYYIRLAERIVQNLSQPTAGGALYRVDTRLRPDAGVGPLARSLQGYLTYYESRGELWERQMLIKARAIAGDLEFGEKFVRALDPFVYPRSHFLHPAEYITRIKERIEAAVGDRANVKLMRGGIRDIEFVVQGLQLLNGGMQSTLRERNTLHALDVLRKANLLSDEDADILRDGYVFFRNLEHRLQMVINAQTHDLPDDTRSRRALARRLGLHDEASLLRETESRSRNVRTVFSRVLTTKGEDAYQQGGGRGILAAVDGGLSEQSVYAIVSEYGFRDVRLAGRHLKTLVHGSTLTGFKDLDSRTREAFRSVASQLFLMISRTPVPDMTLSNLATIVAAQKFPEHMYTQLGQEGFRNLLMKVCSCSPRFSRALARDPLSLETLSTDPHALAPPAQHPMVLPDELLPYKERQELHVGIRHLLDLSDFDGMTNELTSLADAVVSTIFGNEIRQTAAGGAPVAVFALGKFGTRELTYDADIDLIFIADATDADALAVRESSAGEIVGRLSQTVNGGKLYDVDARLRPEGRNAPLVADFSAYVDYLARRASLWERQSLTRLRYITGDPSLGERVTEQIRIFVFGTPLPAGWIAETVAMRRRTETRSRVGGGTFIDFKLGAGGMMDIEFLLQMLQLYSGREDIRDKTVGAILGMKDLPALDSREREELGQAYRLFRGVELQLRIGFDLRTSVLPVGESLETLARLMGFTDGTDVLKALRTTMDRTRSIFLRVARTLEAAGGGMI